MTREAVIVDCARTAFGKRKGALAGWHPTDLLGLVLRAMVDRNDFDPAIVDDLRRLWTADRDRQRLPDGLSERLVVGPERARRQFTALINQARSSIRIIDAKLSDPELVSVLNEKRAAGLVVEAFSGKRVGGLKSHGKIMLIDDETLVVGSLALAALSLDFRREVAIVVTEKAAVAQAADLFTTVRYAAADGRVPAVAEAGRGAGASRLP